MYHELSRSFSAVAKRSAQRMLNTIKRKTDSYDFIPGKTFDLIHPRGYGTVMMRVNLHDL